MNTNALHRAACMLVFCLFASAALFAQQPKEKAPFTAVQYEVGLNGIKTADKAQRIENELKKQTGVTECSLVFLDYKLTLTADYGTFQPENLKAILGKHGVEITTLEQKMIR